MHSSDAAQLIQYTLSPAVMISSAALLLLSLQNKFSNLFNRFRLLNEERRKINQKSAPSANEGERLGSLKLQLEQLVKRIHYVKNAIQYNYLAIFCFVVTSVCLFLDRLALFPLARLATVVFLAGMFTIFVAVLYMVLETRLAFHILKLERKS